MNTNSFPHVGRHFSFTVWSRSCNHLELALVTAGRMRVRAFSKRRTLFYVNSCQNYQVGSERSHRCVMNSCKFLNQCEDGMPVTDTITFCDKIAEKMEHHHQIDWMTSAEQSGHRWHVSKLSTGTRLTYIPALLTTSYHFQDSIKVQMSALVCPAPRNISLSHVKSSHHLHSKSLDHWSLVFTFRSKSLQSSTSASSLLPHCIAVTKLIPPNSTWFIHIQEKTTHLLKKRVTRVFTPNSIYSTQWRRLRSRSLDNNTND